jgi:DNA-binding NarL/FixJ family response regulator
MLLKVNGFDLLRAIKEVWGDKKCSLFIYTDLDDPVSRQRALNLGADHYYSRRELSLDQFIEKFRKIIANREKPRLDHKR